MKGYKRLQHSPALTLAGIAEVVYHDHAHIHRVEVLRDSTQMHWMVLMRVEKTRRETNQPWINKLKSLKRS